MDEQTNPLESGLAWTVSWEPQDRRFMGRDALEKIKDVGLKTKMVGLVLDEKGVLRRHQKMVCDNHGEGEITSGGFSPTLGRSIALARVPVEVEIGNLCHVDMRGKSVAAKVVKYPFVRHGKSCLE